MIELQSAPIQNSAPLLAKLRAQLKDWERFFAQNHDGRKATRDEIKKHPEIDAKYKKYNKLRYPSHGPPVPMVETPSKKRYHVSDPFSPATQPPNKRPKHPRPPHSGVIDPYDPPISSHSPLGVYRTSLGPTPQKDGLVLGLFDSLYSTSKHKSPFKKHTIGSSDTEHGETPSKSASGRGSDTAQVNAKANHLSALSDSKISQVYNLLTPSAERTLHDATPTSRVSVSKLRFDETPPFLKRDVGRPYDKENEDLGGDISWSPISVRRLRKPAGRELSALLKSLREMEDEALDEELEVLRAMESGRRAPGNAKASEVLVNDSQTPDLPLGPDGGLESETEKEQYQGSDKSAEIRKIRGQKRTTRRVLSKPSIVRWKPEPQWKAEEDDLEDEGIATVEETQITDAGLSSAILSVNSDQLVNNSEEHDSQRGDREATRKKGLMKKHPISKVKRKISATSHANFRALKIKRRQPKAKGRERFVRK